MTTPFNAPHDHLRPLLQESHEHCISGRFDAALDALNRALEQDPDSAWAWAHRGDILCQVRGRYLEAIACFSRSLDINPTYTWALAHRGAAYERMDAFAEAERDFRRALSLKPDYTWALVMLCRVLQITGRYDEAIVGLEKVIEQDASVMPDWRAERGILRSLSGSYEAAHGFFLRALETNPADRLALYNAAINMRRWRGLVEAKEYIDRLRDILQPIAPLDARSVYELGGLDALEGRTDEALSHLRDAIAREQGLVLLSPCQKRARFDMAWHDLRTNETFRRLVGSSNNSQDGDACLVSSPRPPA